MIRRLLAIEPKPRIPAELSARLGVRYEIAILDNVEDARGRVLQGKQRGIRRRVDMQDRRLARLCSRGARTIEAAVAKHRSGHRR